MSSHRKILVVRSGCLALLTGFGSLRSDTGGGGERELGVQGRARAGGAVHPQPATKGFNPVGEPDQAGASAGGRAAAAIVAKGE